MIKRSLFPAIFVLSVILGCIFNGRPAHAQHEITIGALLGMTGPKPIADASPPLDDALKDFVSIANEEGGINGKKIRYVMKDDQYKGEVGVRVLHEMMSEHKPFCIFGSGTPVSLAVGPHIRDRYGVLYTSTSFSGVLAQPGLFPSMFVPGPTYGDQVAIALKYIAKAKSRARVAFLYTNDPMGKDPIPYGRIMARDFRLDLVGEALGDMRGGDHSKQILELKGLTPDFVILHGWVGPPIADVIKQCKELGLKSEIIVTVWGTFRSVLDKLGPDGPSFLGVNPYAYWSMEDVPMIRKLRAHTAKHYPDVRERPVPYVVTFTAGLIFAECLRKADDSGRLDAEGLLDALRSLKDFDTGGLTPPLTIRANRFPIARIVRANPSKGIFEPAPLPAGLDKWIQMD